MPGKAPISAPTTRLSEGTIVIMRNRRSTRSARSTEEGGGGGRERDGDDGEIEHVPRVLEETQAIDREPQADLDDEDRQDDLVERQQKRPEIGPSPRRWFPAPA